MPAYETKRNLSARTKPYSGNDFQCQTVTMTATFSLFGQGGPTVYVDRWASADLLRSPTRARSPTLQAGQGRVESRSQ